jgi:hypothetical protein
VTARKAVAVAVALLAVGLSSAACRGQAAAPTSGSVSSTADQELHDIQTTLDAVDSEVAGDGSG